MSTSLSTEKSKILIRLSVNGAWRELGVRPNETLLWTLREQLNLTGSKNGCDMGTCGCCTVLIEGRPILSCLTLTAEVDGKEIETIEGIRPGKELHPLQKQFAQCGGSQCGFCTPGFIVSSVAFLRNHPKPSESEIRHAISGNMCRCTGYVKIVEAISKAAEEVTEASRRG